METSTLQINAVCKHLKRCCRKCGTKIIDVNAPLIQLTIHYESPAMSDDTQYLTKEGTRPCSNCKRPYKDVETFESIGIAEARAQEIEAARYGGDFPRHVVFR